MYIDMLVLTAALLLAFLMGAWIGAKATISGFHALVETGRLRTESRRLYYDGEDISRSDK